MPLPTPKRGEKRQDFIKRCMDNSVMKREFKDKDQRLAVCHSVWSDKKGDRSRKGR